jgi:SAM-dependent methyltransferase
MKLTRDRIRELVGEVYDDLPRVWTSKEGNLAFSGYVGYVEQIDRAHRRYGGGDYKGLRFLDIGISMGVVACVASKLGMQVDGCDYLKAADDPFLTPLRRKYNITYADYDAVTDDLPYPDNTFDIVNCNDMIEHLHASPKRMLENALRVLKPGGVLIITTPNLAALHNRIQLFIGGSVHASIRDWYHNPIWARPVFTGHVREFAPRELKYVLSEAGFRAVEVSTIFSLPGSKRPEQPQDAGLDYNNGFFYLEHAPFYSREFRVRSWYDAALLAFKVATVPLPGARLIAVATGQK